MTSKHPFRTARRSPLVPILVACATLLALPVHSAVTIPDRPLVINGSVPPNLLFVLDDSGSMGFNNMPKDSDDFGNGDQPKIGDNNSIEDRSYAHNTIYYNPNIAYQPWKNATGGLFTGGMDYNNVFTHPWLLRDDNFTTDWTGTNVGLGLNENLSLEDQVFYVPKGTANLSPLNYYRYEIRSVLQADGSGGRVRRCEWLGAGWGSCTFTTPTGRSEADEKRNFATWYSYHRTRMKVAKATATYSFNDPDIFNAESEFRVGYRTIHNRNNLDIPVGVNNGVFSGANKTNWFNRLLNARAAGGTPTSNALYSAGQYFRREDADGPWGPQAKDSQYECRQNFTILTTDGFRNQGALDEEEEDNADPPEFPIGNEDGTPGPAIERPDGSTYQYTPERPYSDNWTDTLADVAMAFWKNDLRGDLDNIVPSTSANPAFWQHMVTFGISIGRQGTLDPQTALPGLTSGSIGWPQPQNLQPNSIDDLWHATVNGRGTFVTAANPEELSSGLGAALRAISERRGSGSNASVSSTSTSAGSQLFQASFNTAGWYGVLQSFNVTSGGVSGTPNWSASIPSSGRRIFTYSGVPASAGTAFPTLAQTAVLGTTVANYVAGDRSQEEPLGPLRARTSLLADIVHSSPVYLRTTNGAPTVFVGANGGMLHAFDATTGAERFAYVPGGINLNSLSEFSEPSYGHKFFVDGPVVVSNRTHISNRTVLVGTLGRGGKGLFALDVTNPATFGAGNVLWDRTIPATNDEINHMGRVMGRPLIAKLNNGQVGVIVSNGVNSAQESAALFIYNLQTGAPIKMINTGVTGNNGLSSPRGWDDDGDGTVDYVYAGDMKGNLWKFDLSSKSNENQWKIAGNGNGPLYAPSNTPSPQPITGGVSIAVDPLTYKRWVFFGTGQLYTTSDLTDTNIQTMYGIIDQPYSSVTRRSNLTSRDIALIDADTGNRAFESAAVLPNDSRGWYIDLDTPPSNAREGERMIGEPQVIKDILVFPTVIPNTSNPCSSGRGYINALNAFTGTSLIPSFFDLNRNGVFTDERVGNNATGSVDLGIGMVTDPAVLDRLLVACGSSGDCGNVPVRNPSSFGRISWREVIRN